MKYSPIVLFLYNRPNHTKLTLNSLAQNEVAIESELFIYCDGMKPNCSERDQENVKAVRQIANEENRFKKVHVFIREHNLGLANSIIGGVTEIINQFGRVIVLEDDLVPSTGFLNYMNEALDLYEYEDKVGCIHAWNYDLETTQFEHSTFFIRGADCWGWATWKESWKLFNPNGKFLLDKIKSNKLQYSFNRNGTHSFVEMLENQIIKKNDSWAIRWHASLFLNDCYCLHPVKPLVLNIGLDGSGTHCGHHKLEQTFENHIINLHKIDIKESDTFYKAFKSYQFKNKKKSMDHVKIFLKKIIPPIFIDFIHCFRSQKSSWSGNYSSWKDALLDSDGYTKPEILEKCKTSTLKVKNGEAKYERDSVLFESIQYSWPLLTQIQKSSIERNGNLNVLDFGGSFGSSYFQNKSFLNDNVNLKWCIIEQDHFVREGIKYFQNEELFFFNSLDEASHMYKPDLIILSSVLQYLEYPKEIIKKICSLNCKYIVIDRTPVTSIHYDFISLQTVPKEIYNASYPSWMFSEEKLLGEFNNYLVEAEFNNGFTNSIVLNNQKVDWKGYILKIKS